MPSSRRRDPNLVRQLRHSLPARRWPQQAWLLALLFFALLLALGAGALQAHSPQSFVRQSLTQFQAPQAVLKLKNAARRAAAPLKLFDISATPVATVSAASFEPTPVAPEAIVASFGVNLATQTALGSDTNPNMPGIQLPTTLAGTTVEVNGRRAGLFFVSAGQVNYLMPLGVTNGTASVVIKSGDGTISNGTVQIVSVSPGIFTANSNGRGVAAANILRVKTNGQQTTEAIAQYNSTTSRFVTKPIDLGPAGEQVFLTLYGSGIRGADDPNGDTNVRESIQVLIGGNEIMPQYAGPQGLFLGLDQINVAIPRTLIGRGMISVSVTARGFSSSNLAEIEIAGTASVTPPQVMGFSVRPALAGQQLTIMGSGFAPVPGDNLVRIAGHDSTVMTATTSQLTVTVPFGVETGTVSVRTPQGESVSQEILPVRTSVSGFVENTARQPLSGITVRISNTNIRATTSNEGSFVLPDVPPGVHFFEVDGGSIPTTPPYPKVTRKITAFQNRDNQVGSAISLQQSTGSGGPIGGGTALMAEYATAADQQQTPQQQVVTLQTGNFSFQYPSNISATFPSGASTGSIILTKVQDAALPVEVPLGVFSSSVVQITPFNVKLNPGGRLVFPNSDGFPAGVPAKLFRYDSTKGVFLEMDNVTCAVSADGQRIETGPNDIKDTSFYFAAIPRQMTTVVGRVLDGRDNSPVSRATVRLRGQEAVTDGNGSYILRFIPANTGDPVATDVGLLRATGRVDRVRTEARQALLGNITRLPDAVLPRETANRPPVVLFAPRVTVAAGSVKNQPIIVSDPDPGQTVQLSVSGASFATLTRDTAETPGVDIYSLRLAPPVGERGEFQLRLTATDNAQPPTTTVQNMTVSVFTTNLAPVALAQTVNANEDTPVGITLKGSDPEDKPLRYSIEQQPRNGGLTGTAPNLTYVPIPNFNGSDSFTFKVSDGSLDSAPATVQITVRPVNDPPVLTVPGPQTINEGQTLSFELKASDVDTGQTYTFGTVAALPAGAALTQTGPLTALFRWTPTLTQSGNYSIVFKVTETGAAPLSDSKEVKISVNDVAGILSAPAQQMVSENQPLSFPVSIAGQVTGAVTITATNLPRGAAFAQPTLSSGQLTWTPDFTQAGSYTVNIRAVGGSPPITDSRDVKITVLDVRRDFSRERSDWIIYGNGGTLTRIPPDNGDALGASMATGDLNGDGLADLAVGAPLANAVGQDSGKVYIFFGKSTLTGALDLVSDAPDTVLLGEAADDQLGTAVAIADVNGDGKSDLITSAPLADTTDRRDCGKAYVIFGAFPPPGLQLGRSILVSNAAGATVIGAKAGDNLGAALAAGMINSKSGPADLVISAPLADAAAPSGPNGIDAGAVYVVMGGSGLSREKDLAASPANFVVTGASANARIGVALAAGNFNNDDFGDLVVGAPFENLTDKRGVGKAYLFLGAETLSGTKTTQAASFNWAGSGENDNFGAALTMGDFDGDGLADLAAGAPGATFNNFRGVGGVYLYYGSATAVIRTLVINGVGIQNDANPDGFGAVLAAGDLTGDGLADLVVGAPGADLVNSSREPSGAAYAIFGVRGGFDGNLDLARKSADLTIYAADPGDKLGFGAMAVGDLNGGEAADLILGVPRGDSFNNTRREAGEIRVLFGVAR